MAYKQNSPFKQMDINPFDKESRDKRQKRRAQKGKGSGHCGYKGKCAPTKTRKMGTGAKLGAVGAGVGAVLDYSSFASKHNKPGYQNNPQNKGMLKRYLKKRGEQLIDFITN